MGVLMNQSTSMPSPKQRARVATKHTLRNAKGMATGVEIRFVNGKVSRLDLADCTASMQAELACHGAKQKGGDAFSNEPNPDLAFALTEAVFDSIRLNVFNRKGSTMVNVADLIKALCMVEPEHTEVEWTKAVNDAKEERRKDIARRPKVAVALAEIALERRKAQMAAKGEPDKGESLFSLFK